MSTAYTTDTRVRLFLGTDRVTALGDRDESGAIDTGLMDDAIARIGNRIDGALGTRYTVPFAATTASPATPGQVADLADLGVGMLLYKWLAPSSPDAKTLREDFEGEDGAHGLLGRYRTGDEIIPGAAEAAAETAQRSASYESIGTSIAGALDASGSRTGAWSQTDSTDQADGI